MTECTEAELQFLMKGHKLIFIKIGSKIIPFYEVICLNTCCVNQWDEVFNASLFIALVQIAVSDCFAPRVSRSEPSVTVLKKPMKSAKREKWTKFSHSAS